MLRELGRRIGAGKGHVPGVVQQTNFGTGDLHQTIDIARGLDISAYVMMIGEAHAARQRVAGKPCQALPIRRPLGIGPNTGSSRKRFGAALDRIGDLAVNHDFRTVARKQSEVRFDGLDLVGHCAAGEMARIPARDTREAVAREHGTQRVRHARKLVAELEALVPDRLAFRKSGLKRRLAAEGRQVIVRPRNRVDTDARGECLHGFCAFLPSS